MDIEAYRVIARSIQERKFIYVEDDYPCGPPATPNTAKLWKIQQLISKKAETGTWGPTLRPLPPKKSGDQTPALVIVLQLLLVALTCTQG